MKKVVIFKCGNLVRIKNLEELACVPRINDIVILKDENNKNANYKVLSISINDCNAEIAVEKAGS